MIRVYLCDGNHGLREDTHGLLQDPHSGDGGERQRGRYRHAEADAGGEDGDAGCDRRQPEHENVERCEVDVFR